MQCTDWCARCRDSEPQSPPVAAPSRCQCKFLDWPGRTPHSRVRLTSTAIYRIRWLGGDRWVRESPMDAKLGVQAERTEPDPLLLPRLVLTRCWRRATPAEAS